MKTYKPKKPVYKEIENVQELCRLCLETAQDGVTIFKDGQDVCAAVAMRIMICVGLEMKHDQSLPNMICTPCCEELEKYYKFRRKCQLSHQKLKHHILALKLKHQKVKIDVPIVNVPVSESVRICGADNVKLHVKSDEKPLLPQSDEQPAGVKENVAGKTVEIEEIETPIHLDESSNIRTFLSTVLVELGILSQERGLLHHHGVTSFQLETGDAEQLELELVEENDDGSSSSSSTTHENIFEKHAGQETVDIKDEKAVIIDIKPNSVITRRDKMSRPWCSLCGRAFSSRSALTRHVRGHSGLRPHVCSVCGAAFQQKAVLRRHMLVHLDVRPHCCSLCNKSFTQRSSLEAHVRTHAAPHARPLALHTCTTCHKVFLYASGLSRHLMTHLGRVYECTACDKRFKDRSSLIRHLKRVCHKHAVRSTSITPTDDTSFEPAIED